MIQRRPCPERSRDAHNLKNNALTRNDWPRLVVLLYRNATEVGRVGEIKHSRRWYDERRSDNLNPLPGSPGHRNLAGFPNWLIVCCDGHVEPPASPQASYHSLSDSSTPAVVHHLPSRRTIMPERRPPGDRPIMNPEIPTNLDPALVVLALNGYTPCYGEPRRPATCR